MTDELSEFELERIYDAPRDLVYKVWTDPRYVRLWWGIDASTIGSCELDVREGGAWRIDMRTQSGVVYPNGGVFTEVIENERLVYTNIADPRSPAWVAESPPGPLVHTVRFEDHADGKTKVSMVTRASSAGDLSHLLRRGFAAGLSQGLERLAGLLETLRQPMRERERGST
ncbi:Uncharacterized conserved protein YndB, AHSA1/START domain [Rhizobiales bacterium GAS188]|nr:Uncharacterized conserved protein YndB, AHSA1/START domain [Rhizobiales bacterium GAS188]